MAQGDHIRVKRRGYWHHGIDCGDGTVINYAGEHEEKRNPMVRRTSIEEFAKSATIRRVDHPEAFCHGPEAVVARAEARLGENRYRLLDQNCEHFAEWCKTGTRRSLQVRRTAGLVTGMVSAVGGVVGVGAALAGMVVAARRNERSRRI